MAYTPEQVNSLKYKELQEAAAALGHAVVGVSKDTLKGYLLAAPQSDPGDETPPPAVAPLADVPPNDPPSETPPTIDLPNDTNGNEDEDVAHGQLCDGGHVENATLHPSFPNQAPDSVHGEARGYLWRPMIWIRGACSRLGVNLAGLFGMSDMRHKVQDMGLESDIESMAEALGISETIKPDLLSGPVILHDGAGDYTFCIYSDGSAEIIRYESPNRVYRLPGQQIAGDITVRVPDLYGFAELAMLAVESADLVFDDMLVAEKMAGIELQHRQEQEAKPTSLPEVMNPKLIFVWLEEQREIYGFPVKIVSAGELPYKVCEALGVEYRKPLIAGDGTVVCDAQGNTVLSDQRVGYDEAVELIKAHINWNEPTTAS